MEEQDGGNVLIIDLDPQGDTARGLGLEPDGQCVSNVLLGRGSVETLRENVMWADRSAEGGPDRPNLFVIPATDRLSEAKEDILTEIALFAARSMRSRRAGEGRHLVNILDEKLGLAKNAFEYIMELDGSQKIFPANYDITTVVENCVDYTAQHFEKNFMVHRVFRRLLTNFGVLIPNMKSVFLYRAQIFQN